MDVRQINSLPEHDTQNMDLQQINSLSERYVQIMEPLSRMKTRASDVNDEIKQIKAQLIEFMEINNMTELETNQFHIKLKKKKHIARLDQRMLVDALEEVLGAENLETIQAILDKIETKKRSNFTFDTQLKFVPK